MRLRTLGCSIFATAAIGAIAACGRSGAELDPSATGTPTPTPSGSPSPSFRKTLTVAGTDIAGIHAGFPLLVAITTDDDLRSAANGGVVADGAGGDIGFSQDGLTLPHEIEQYDPVAGTLVAWVRVPLLVQDSSETLSLELGGPIRAPTGPAVWDSAFAAVWHLSDPADSTVNGNDLLEQGASPMASGRISDAYSFDGTDDFLRVTSTQIPLTDEFTLSAWIRLGASQSDLGDYARIVERWSGSSGGYGLFFENTDNPQFGVHSADGTSQDNATPSLTFAPGDWYYVVGVWRPNPGEKSVHVGSNSGFSKSGASAAGNNSLVTPSGPVLIGGDPVSASSPFFNGRIDEVRITSVARDDDWIQTEFQNQSTPETFVTVGPLLPAN